MGNAARSWFFKLISPSAKQDTMKTWQFYLDISWKQGHLSGVYQKKGDREKKWYTDAKATFWGAYSYRQLRS